MNDDEVLYERVSREMADGDIKEGMWTKAYANAMGDEGKAAVHLRAFLRRNASADEAKRLTLERELHRARRELARMESC